MQVQSPFDREGRIQHMVHLCSGDYPDFFTEIIFGKIARADTARWHSAYVARIWEYSGYGTYLEPVHPATETQTARWHTVVLAHDGATSQTQNHLVVDGKWILDPDNSQMEENEYSTGNSVLWIEPEKEYLER